MASLGQFPIFEEGLEILRLLGYDTGKIRIEHPFTRATKMQDHEIQVFPTSCTELEFLRPSIEHTFQIIDEFIECQSTGGYVEVPYWSNERATLSLLAGGIWRADCKNLVLEEYHCTKGEGDKKWRGRRDIWFQIRQEVCHAEAKQDKACWPRASDFGLNDAQQCVEVAIQEAKDASRDAVWSTKGKTLGATGSASTSSSGNIRCFGIAFITPHLLLNDQPDSRKILERFEETLVAAIRQTAEQSNYRFLMARYLCSKLLERDWFYDSKYYGGGTSLPELITLICEPAC